MAYSEILTADAPDRSPASGTPLSEFNRSAASAVSWGAIAAGAAAAAALSLVLLILGTGLGLGSVSPWSQNGITATTFGVSTILWVTLTQILASGMGGYLAGRLRTRWQATEQDEVYFRDTAHGFLSWAVASLATAALLASVIGSIVSGSVQAGASVAGSAVSAATTAAATGGSDRTMAATAGDGGPVTYFVDSMFRRDSGAAAIGATPSSTPAGAQTSLAPVAPNAASTTEVARIFARSIRTNAMAPDDLRYVGQLVAERTGLPQAEADKRVSTAFTRAQAALRDAELALKEAADKTRKASAYAALWLFISLLTGAFVASLAATYGGRQRDL